jgi:hypothetical protein
MAWVNPKITWATTDPINYTDFNRVEGNTEYLKDVLVNDFGKTISMTFEAWNNTGFPYFDELNRMEGNIDTINSNWAEPTGWVTPITDWVTGSIVRTNNASGAVLMNRMEVDLGLLYTSINGTADYLLPCGTFTAGTDHVRQHFTRS